MASEKLASQGLQQIAPAAMVSLEITLIVTLLPSVVSAKSSLAVGTDTASTGLVVGLAVGLAEEGVSTGMLTGLSLDFGVEGEYVSKFSGTGSITSTKPMLGDTVGSFGAIRHVTDTVTVAVAELPRRPATV